MDELRRERILERVRATPEGCVATYGDVSPGAPRLAGRVLFDCEDPTVPWHRIVRADGSLAKGERQRRKLLAEGVPFHGERVAMRDARFPHELIELGFAPAAPAERAGEPGHERRTRR